MRLLDLVWRSLVGLSEGQVVLVVDGAGPHGRQCIHCCQQSEAVVGLVGADEVLERRPGEVLDHDLPHLGRHHQVELQRDLWVKVMPLIVVDHLPRVPGDVLRVRPPRHDEGGAVQHRPVRHLVVGAAPLCCADSEACRRAPVTLAAAGSAVSVAGVASLRRLRRAPADVAQAVCRRRGVRLSLAVPQHRRERGLHCSLEQVLHGRRAHVAAGQAFQHRRERGLHCIPLLVHDPPPLDLLLLGGERLAALCAAEAPVRRAEAEVVEVAPDHAAEVGAEVVHERRHLAGRRGAVSAPGCRPVTALPRARAAAVAVRRARVVCAPQHLLERGTPLRGGVVVEVL